MSHICRPLQCILVNNNGLRLFFPNLGISCQRCVTQMNTIYSLTRPSHQGMNQKAGKLCCILDTSLVFLTFLLATVDIIAEICFFNIAEICMIYANCGIKTENLLRAGSRDALSPQPTRPTKRKKKEVVPMSGEEVTSVGDEDFAGVRVPVS